MGRPGPLRSAVGGLLGFGPGRGMAFLLVILGLLTLALAVAGLHWRTLCYMEDTLPDAVPGAVLTWDRDALQREADRALVR